MIQKKEILLFLLILSFLPIKGMYSETNASGKSPENPVKWIIHASTPDYITLIAFISSRRVVITATTKNQKVKCTQRETILPGFAPIPDRPISIPATVFEERLTIAVPQGTQKHEALTRYHSWIKKNSQS